MCRFEGSHSFRNQAFAAPRMVAGRLLCQMVWSLMGNRTQNGVQNQQSEQAFRNRENLMKFQNWCLLLLVVVALAGGIRTVGADRVDPPPSGPVRVVTTEPGVVPTGTSLVVRTNDSSEHR